MATSSGTMVEVGSDGGLVLGTLAGDRDAFAQLYDRFAIPVHDLQLALSCDPRRAEEATYRTFERAVAELKHLGEPSGLRPRLYAIAYRVGRSRPRRFGLRSGPRLGRTGDRPRFGRSGARPSGARPAGSRAPEEQPSGAGPARPTGDDPQARLWRLAPPGLTALDRALVTLCLRHGLGYAEVGRVVGLSASRVHIRMSAIRPWCDVALHGLLTDADREATPVPADNDTAPLRTAVPLVAPPYAVRERVLSEVRLLSAHEGLPRPRGRAAWLATGLTALLLVTGTTMLVQHNLSRPETVAVSFGPSSELTLSTTVLDLGAAGSTATVTLSNTGARNLDWRASPADPWLTVGPPAGSLAGGTAQALTITVDRNALAEGDGHSRLIVAGAGGQAEVAIALRHERPPTIVSARAAAGTIGGYGCPVATTITAVVRDESGPVRVTLLGPGQQSQVMQGNDEVYTGRLGSGGAAGITWRVVATDARNNTTTSPARLIVHGDCAARPAPPKPLVRTPAPVQAGGPAVTRPGAGAGGAPSGDAGGAEDQGSVPGIDGDEDSGDTDDGTAEDGRGSADDSGSGGTGGGSTGGGTSGGGTAGRQPGTTVDSDGAGQNFSG